MNRQKSPTDAARCPLCNGLNHCGNLTSNDQPCWCMAEDVVFTQNLLQQVPASRKHKACICQECVKKNQNVRAQGNEQPDG
ncbi:cysteine-rich CWC family protein [Alteromonas sp. 14N.309.X.WAT.G.H12]|uniref:cysteine-rich CWC family protein n=1 Tax=Alteromonas sp. 14N.309.X.WAT.G.H12 TaxID=3120824 RepID=UPI002FD4D2C6